MKVATYSIGRLIFEDKNFEDFVDIYRTSKKYYFILDTFAETNRTIHAAASIYE